MPTGGDGGGIQRLNYKERSHSQHQNHGPVLVTEFLKSLFRRRDGDKGDGECRDPEPFMTLV